MAWFATAALALACFQLLTAAWIFRKLPISRPRWVPALHRWSGRVAFACALPVVYHCIFKLGFQTRTTRVLVHSFLGCAVYGAFASKVLIVRLHRFPRWVLPTASAGLARVFLGRRPESGERSPRVQWVEGRFYWSRLTLMAVNRRFICSCSARYGRLKR